VTLASILSVADDRAAYPKGIKIRIAGGCCPTGRNRIGHFTQ